MHFPLLASLITTLSLISVACAAPNRAPQFHLHILDQDNPIASIDTAVPDNAQKLGITPPLIALRQFLWEDKVLGGLSYAVPSKSLPTITLRPLHPTYLGIMESRLEQKLPVYARLLALSHDRVTGCRMQNHCLAIIRKSSAGSPHGAIIETKSGTLIAQVGDLGDLAIVSFLNPQPTTDPNAHPDTIAKADTIAKHMVEWFLTDESVWKEKLGFAALPKIIHINSLPTHTTEYHFTLYGGTKCLKPCSGLVNLVITAGQPINMYHGVVYEHESQHPLAQLIHAIEGGEHLTARSIDSPLLL